MARWHSYSQNAHVTLCSSAVGRLTGHLNSPTVSRVKQSRISCSATSALRCLDNDRPHWRVLGTMRVWENLAGVRGFSFCVPNTVLYQAALHSGRRHAYSLMPPPGQAPKRWFMLLQAPVTLTERNAVPPARTDRGSDAGRISRPPQ
jgi:hypothetical protein